MNEFEQTFLFLMLAISFLIEIGLIWILSKIVDEVKAWKFQQTSPKIESKQA